MKPPSQRTYLEFGHLLGEVKQRLRAFDVHVDGHLQGLVKLDCGRRVENDAHLKNSGRE